MLAKKTFNDPKIRRSTAVLYKKSTAVPMVPVLKKYRGTFVHGTAHLCQCLPNFFSLEPPWLPDRFPAPLLFFFK